MKYYKIINLERQHIGSFVVPQSGWNEIQKNPGLTKTIQLLGECDAGGNLLTDLKEDNFLTKTVLQPVEKPTIIDNTEKPTITESNGKQQRRESEVIADKKAGTSKGRTATPKGKSKAGDDITGAGAGATDTGK
jgi:hypothetical protein